MNTNGRANATPKLPVSQSLWERGSLTCLTQYPRWSRFSVIGKGQQLHMRTHDFSVTG